MQTTCFSDPASGGLIELNEAIVKVINTPEFGRLQYIKQTGGCYMVYPSATHTRFQHSLGTCYLAGEVVKRLKEQQPILDINDRDILAVELAALCHDLGHGPLSHTFDQFFIPLAKPGSKWTHEEGSIMMFRHLLANNPDVKAYLEDILEPEDFVFIEEAICPEDELVFLEWPYTGRPIEKAFLYDIVSNKAHGFDVDKWDYTRRDAGQMGISINTNLSRLLNYIRVIRVGNRGRPTICYRDKVRGDLSNLAETRAKLHSDAYQHRTVKVIEAMIVDALLIADKHLQFFGVNGQKLCLSDTITDMEAYRYATDDVIFGDILRSTAKELAEARKILDRVLRRRLYAKVAQAESTDPNDNAKFGTGMCRKTAQDIAVRLRYCNDDFRAINEENLANNLVVVISDIHGGMKDQNPVGNVWFYRKDKEKKYKKSKDSTKDKKGPKKDSRKRETEVASDEDDLSKPRPFHYKKEKLPGTPTRKKIIRVFCRQDDDNLIECALACFNGWCEANGLPPPQDMMDTEEGDELEYASLPASLVKEPSPATVSSANLEAVKKNLMRAGVKSKDS